jgi:hypothetical protein
MLLLLLSPRFIAINTRVLLHCHPAASCHQGHDAHAALW